MLNKQLNKYLQCHAQEQVRALESFPEQLKFDHVIVIPAYKESLNFIERFVDSVLAQLNVLFIAVINQPSSDTDLSCQQGLFNQACTLGKLEWHESGLHLVSLTSCVSQLLLVDAFTEPMPCEQGVGLARKIGADLAVALINKGNITSDWIHSSDADASLPIDYFAATQTLSAQTVAACYNFTHACEQVDVHRATQQYEQALRYYVAGLKYAGSSYAFFTIGSTLAFRASAYVMVRGFPKRSAGEDFYLLNKLAKLGEVAFLAHSIISIEARTSDRVPFGTGPAVSKILSLQANEQVYCYYHPTIFTLLKSCLTAFECLWNHRACLDDWLAQQSPKVSASLLALNIRAFVDKQVTSNQQQFDKQLRVWFDAFKTLKFIHAMREQGYQDIPLTQALSQAKFTNHLHK